MSTPGDGGQVASLAARAVDDAARAQKAEHQTVPAISTRCAATSRPQRAQTADDDGDGEPPAVT